MKIALPADVKSGNTMEQTQVPKEVPVKSKWFKCGVLVLMLVFLTTITVFAVLIYDNTKVSGKQLRTDVAVNVNYPTKTSTEKPKAEDVEVNITSHIVPTGEDIKEDIVISDQEEDISTPKTRVIYDYASGYSVTKYKDSEEEICYVSEFDVLGSIDGIRDSLEKEGNETFVYTNATEEVYETTGETVNITLLSPRAAEMCADSQVLRVVRVEDDSPKRVERGCYYICGTVCNLRYGTYRVKTCAGKWWRRRCKYRSAIGLYWQCQYRCQLRCFYG